MGIVAVILGFVLTVIGGLVAVIFNELRKQLRDNTKHVESVMSTIGPLMWRVITVEDWLEENYSYHPPRDIGWSEHK